MKSYNSKRLAVGVSSAGFYHEVQGIPCQDSVNYYSDDIVCCAALADGAGSVEQSEFISQYVTSTLVEDFKTYYQNWFIFDDNALMDHIISICSKSLNKNHPELKLDCTLLFWGEADGHSLLIHVGDGNVVACGEKSDILSQPENGDEPNITFFLSSKNLSEHFRVMRDIDQDYSTIVMSSDGAASLLYNYQNKTVTNAVSIMAKWVEEGNGESEIKNQLSETIESLFKDYSSDDISIIIVYR